MPDPRSPRGRMRMAYLVIFLLLLLAAGLCVLLERRGWLASPRIELRRDPLREALFISQYGQGSCLLLVLLIILSLDASRRWSAAGALLVGSVLAFLVGQTAKRLFGRIRPGRHGAGERSGQFLGPFWGWDSYRESFPSSHAAGAFAMSAALTWLYPSGAFVWWALAILTATLRWLLDAHWLSDVLAGCAIGLGCGLLGVWIVGV